MSWVRIESKALSHPKVLQVGRLGLGVWVASLCWCDEHETDGFIPEHALPLILMDAPRKTVKALLSARLWHQVEGGYQIHDYTEFQPKASEKRAKRDAAKERMAKSRKGGARSVRANTTRTDGEQDAKFPRSSPNTETTTSTRSETRSPEAPDPQHQPPHSEQPAGAEVVALKPGRLPKLDPRIPRAWERLYGRPLYATDPRWQALQEIQAAHDHGAELILGELEPFAMAGGRNVQKLAERVDAAARGEGWSGSPRAAAAIAEGEQDEQLQDVLARARERDAQEREAYLAAGGELKPWER